MKKFLFSLILLLVSYVGFSQKGLSYQAVILDPAKIEIPGQDISSQPLVNGDVWLKFSIYNGSTLQFEEVHKTKTDAYGLVNLLIGSVSSASFNSLVWDSSQKNLQVFVSFNQGGSYTKISDQKLNYNPYALFAETAGKLSGVLPVANGGTGATTAADARANLGLDQVNNTSDAAKPVSTATQTALNLKANAADVIAVLALKANAADMSAALAAKADTGTIKAYVDSKIGSNNITSNQSSSSNISSAALAAKADTSFVLAQVAAATIADADATTKGKIQLAGDLAGTAAAPAVPGLALKANVTDLVTLTSSVNSNTASITSNSAAIISEATTARAAELVLTNNVAANTASITSNATNLVGLTTTVVANTASITANTNAITLKAPIASPVFTGTVAIGTANPSAGAVLDITSTSKGLLLPRLTFAQKSAIVSPEAGLILWCSDCGTNGELQVYNGTNFVNMVGANAQFALPSVTSTALATSITSSALTSGGVIDADGGAFVTARGVVWNTSTNPTISLSTKTTDGTGIGTFSSAITGLTSGVTYYVRAYATNSVGTKYGPEISVNTAQAVATLASTTSASSIGANTATSGGNITYNGGATITVSGLVWSTSANPTTSDSKTTNGTTNGIFTSNITGLTPGTLYFVRSYATNSVGTSYGAQTSFTTLNTATISATAPATSITSATATTGGTITSDGGASVTARGVVYGTSSNASTYSVTTGSGTGTFVSNLTGLNPATTYFVRSFVTNSVGTVYGTETSFTTIAIAPTLTTTAASIITKYAASAGGSIASNGGSAITASGICWSTTATPTTSDFKTTDGTTTGTFTSVMTGLTAGTTYYVRAYATNAIGTGYGDAQSFTTSSPALILPTVGSSYGGGKVAYVYQNGDPGYSSSSIPVLIAANADQVGNLSGGTALWSITGASGVAQRVGLIGSSYEALGAGLSNTNAIISAYGTGNYAAKFAKDYTDGTYNDWYMPSINELGKLYLNRVAIGGFSTQYYWSSTEVQETSTQISGYSWSFNGSGNDKHMDTKAWNMKIRAVRTTTIVPSTSSAPIVAATTSAASITSSSAILGGNVTDEGSTEVSARGLVYGTSTGASTYSVTIGSGAGIFTSTLTGLTQGATYYVRSFATNVQGTSYGIETSFTTQTTPTVSATSTPTSVTTTTAIGGGTISSTGGATITSGLVWGASINPTIALSTKTTDGTTSSTFTSSITGLTQGTTYHVRAYATNYLGTSYGPDVTFTTIAPPTISGTSSATSITSSTATAGGTITSDGGASVTSRGLVYGTSSGASTFSITTGTGTGTYTSSLTGLSPATTYFIRSFATNSVGTVYGTETSFTTIAIAPTLTTTAASSITKYAANAGGSITSNGGSVITASGICWSTTATPTISDSKTTDGTTSGTFTSSITGLTAGTTYYVRAYATNAIGTSYGAAESFTTLSTPVAQTSVLIGTQRWTDKNLNVANYRNGDAITYAADAAQWAAANAAGVGAYTYLKYASGDGGATYGKLYNWYAVNDVRGLAPTGYHIPTKAEWTTLRGTQAGNGTTLKSSTTDWSGTFSNVNNNIVVAIHPSYSSYNGTNSTGFNALPGGSLFPNGTNGNYGSASYWTATIDAGNSAKANWIYFHPTFLFDGFDCCGTYELGNGMSVRLVKDNNLVESSPTTPVLASTTSATSITANSTMLGGNVTDEGATQVSARGLVYGTSTGSSTFSVTVGSGAGTFTSTLTGLTQGATYYVRSFATNVQGTTYGAETSFTTQTTPTVSATSAPTSVGTTTAIGGGTIGSTGGATITTSGLVWGATVNPTIALSTKTTDGTTSGTFTSSITGLTQGTTYHVRAYATNYLGTSYGPDITFTTLTTPTVSATATISSITGTTATGGGTITADGGASVTSRGVVYGTSSGSSTYSSTSGTGTGAYVSSLTGLIPVTTYYVRAFATNSVGTVYGTETSFTTSAGPASKAMITTEPSGAAAGTAFTTQPVIRITDASGNTVTSSTVNVVASIASGAGTLGGTTTVAAVNGVATFTNLVLSGATGNFTLAFTPTSLTAATSNSFALSFGTASKAMITIHPSGAVNGVALTTQPVIRITDASGNTVTSSTVNVVASIGSGTGGTLSGTTTVAAVNGVATFTNLVLSGSPGSFTVTFTPTSLTATTSNSFALSVGAASMAMITTQPAGAFNGIEFSTQPIVKITDAGGNTITSSTANVVATIASGSGTLGGTTAVNAVAGVANFTNLKITGTGNHTLTFTPTGGLTAATSNTLNVAQLGCAQGGSCAIGETGPGGGKVFYYSAAGFSCGPDFSSTCHYLEVAPVTWKASTDPIFRWDPNGGDDVHANIPNNANPHLLTSEIGLGYQNSVVLFNFYGNNDDYAAGAARRYAGGGKSDWYLGSAVEMNILAYWSKGQTAPNPLGISSGTMIQGNFESISGAYWTSSQGITSEYFDTRKQTFGTTASPGPDHKSKQLFVRPIRAF